MVVTDSGWIEARVKSLPECPGVYLMKDAAGQIIYIGKAANLNNRVRSYFSGGSMTPKTAELVGHIRDIDIFVTGSEEEALVLELTLVKRHRPHYNIRLKDDKGFPYLRIDLNEDWARVQIVRHPPADNARYFGPFASSLSINRTLDVAKNIFPFRTCNQVLRGTPKRPCLEYDMHHCPAPCAGYITREDYQIAIKGLVCFLEGRNDVLEKSLAEQMKQAAAQQKFELAARLRDQLSAVKEIIRWQKLAARVRGDLDVVAVAQENDGACAQVFMIRNGGIIGKESYVIQGAAQEEARDILSSFIEQYYGATASVPPLILAEYAVANRSVIQKWLAARRGGAVALSTPVKGPRRDLMKMVSENAVKALEQHRLKNMTQPFKLKAALNELQQHLNLAAPPARIEGYDISNLQGKMAVGSMVVFEGGRPSSRHYRRFRIKTISQADDYAMLQEVLKRRFALHDGGTMREMVIPDLILIDGGKGQLNAALEALHSVAGLSVPVISLAKGKEEIFVPGAARGLVLPAGSVARQLLQRIRDEAHRFAVGYHRTVRKHAAFASEMEEVTGLGPRRRAALLKHFGSPDRIKQASTEELARVPGISPRLAAQIKEHFQAGS